MPEEEQVEYPLTVEITAEIREMIYGLCTREFDFVHKGSPAHQGLSNIVSWLDGMPDPVEGR